MIGYKGAVHGEEQKEGDNKERDELQTKRAIDELHDDDLETVNGRKMVNELLRSGFRPRNMLIKNLSRIGMDFKCLTCEEVEKLVDERMKPMPEQIFKRKSCENGRYGLKNQDLYTTSVFCTSGYGHPKTKREVGDLEGIQNQK